VAQTQKCGSSSRTPRGSRLSAHGHLIFELVKLNGESPEEVAKELGVQRNVIDNTIIKAMKKLREISQREEIQQELRQTRQRHTHFR
jgi:transposase